ncbi:MAG: putative transport system permease protein [Acidobacteriota bacterium]|jgi:ABC-type antimicrobial peptide transport system permease subunit|nr:putative transport system permease protein [Acidobacteriota bacterium]
MAIPFKYNIGNLTSRRVSTLLTIIGIGVVNAVLVSMLALWNGVKHTTSSSGSAANLIVLRDGSETELSSWFEKGKENVIRTLPGIAKRSNGEPLVSPELMMLFKLPRKGDAKESNVEVRALRPVGFEMRPNVKMIEGRVFKPGLNEVIVAKRLHDRFAGMDVGDSFKFGSTVWNVVGVFDAGGTAFDSEIWADLDYFAAARKRTSTYSSILVQPVDAAALKSVKETVENDHRLQLMAKTEQKYYAEQTSGLFGVIILVGFVTIFMVVGAILGTMNTMFTAVASRKRELATMRALGFKRRAILASIVIESAVVSFFGGVAGLIIAWPIRFVTTGTTNFRTFSEVVFNFRIDWKLAATTLTIAVIAGVIGGLAPAISAAWMPITRALREI